MDVYGGGGFGDEKMQAVGEASAGVGVAKRQSESVKCTRRVGRLADVRGKDQPTDDVVEQQGSTRKDGQFDGDVHSHTTRDVCRMHELLGMSQVSDISSIGR